MAELVAIVGESGSGKTSSIRNLNPEEVFIISTTGKRPGTPGAKKKYVQLTQNPSTKEFSGNFFTTTSVDNFSKIVQVVDKKMPKIKYIIVDDFQYFMAFEALDRAKEKSYEKFTEMAQHAYQVLKEGLNLRDDLYFIILTHQANTGTDIEPFYRIKTLGKMLDNTITLEGLFTYVLFARPVVGEDGKMTYKFLTNSDGTCTAKTPMGLFEDLYIDNDLKLVVDRIEEYNAG